MLQKKKKIHSKKKKIEERNVGKKSNLKRESKRHRGILDESRS